MWPQGRSGKALPYVVPGDFALVVAIQQVYDANLFQRDRGELADGDVHDGTAQTRGDPAEDGAGRLRSHVDHVAVDGHGEIEDVGRELVGGERTVKKSLPAPIIL